MYYIYTFLLSSMCMITTYLLVCITYLLTSSYYILTYLHTNKIQVHTNLNSQITIKKLISSHFWLFLVKNTSIQHNWRLLLRSSNQPIHHPLSHCVQNVILEGACYETLSDWSKIGQKLHF